MTRIGISGNIGSGKSLIVKILKLWDYPIFIADDVSKDHLFSLKNRNQIIQILGNQIVNTDGKLSTKEISKIIFSNRDKKLDLENFLHPLVINDFEVWSKKQTKAHFMESAIIFEKKLEYLFDYVIHISAPVDVRIDRCLKRGDGSIEDIRNRIMNQIEDSIKIKKSDFVIYNYSNKAILPQIDEILSQII